MTAIDFKNTALLTGQGRLPYLLLACIVVCFFSCRGKNTSSETVTDGVVVVATSSWTAAFARAAGAEDVVVLAPFDMTHPSEYELRPSDIPKLIDASVIVFAGYEVMTARLKRGLSLPAEKLLQIDTDYSYASMERSIMEIAAKLGTESRARVNLSEIRRVMDAGKQTFEEKGMTGFPVVVHQFQSSLIRELGLVPKMIFGPASPEVSKIVAVSKTDAILIVDNFHNPVGQPFKDVLSRAHYCCLLNFPGQKGTVSLIDVIQYNISQLLEVGSLRTR